MKRFCLWLPKKSSRSEESGREVHVLADCEKSNDRLFSDALHLHQNSPELSSADVSPIPKKRRAPFRLSSSDDESPDEQQRNVQPMEENKNISVISEIQWQPINEKLSQISVQYTDETDEEEGLQQFPSTSSATVREHLTKITESVVYESTEIDAPKERSDNEHPTETVGDKAFVTPATTSCSRSPASTASRTDNLQSLQSISRGEVSIGASASTIELAKYTSAEFAERIEKSALLDGTFFKVCARVENINRIPVQCQLCNGERQLIGSLTVSTNLVKHLKRFHDDKHSKYLDYKKIKRLKTKRLALPPKSVNRLTAKRRKVAPSAMSFKSRIARFVIETISPLSIVDQPTFKDLFSDFDIKVISRRSLTRHIDKLDENRFTMTKTEISKAKYVCTTTDIWTGRRKSFFGVTCHFINEHFKRQSFPLACRRFTGSHSYDRIADLLSDIHNAYGLDHRKIVASITDNATNFVKAFTEFGIVLNSSMLNETSEANEEFDEGLDDSFSDSESDTDISHSPEIENIQISRSLPTHMRCASHTLNLVATTDLMKTVKENVRLYTRL